eukprot:CAMPEP_0172521438 /NCGR_PEP_ID=MMETSP1066-20121228/292580_1 /TAXON_ID=671091 /ORGANISM="Coscinodiscus wailesii, Strain CCMP2513" /LENGTH=328 /DNA_ID=CAMNT_0013304351 /DNA_START=133 /DNA_END=1120 /DNA_ORIENTATION=+
MFPPPLLPPDLTHIDHFSPAPTQNDLSDASHKSKGNDKYSSDCSAISSLQQNLTAADKSHISGSTTKHSICNATDIDKNTYSNADDGILSDETHSSGNDNGTPPDVMTTYDTPDEKYCNADARTFPNDTNCLTKYNKSITGAAKECDSMTYDNPDEKYRNADADIPSADTNYSAKRNGATTGVEKDCDTMTYNTFNKIIVTLTLVADTNYSAKRNRATTGIEKDCDTMTYDTPNKKYCNANAGILSNDTTYLDKRNEATTRVVKDCDALMNSSILPPGYDMPHDPPTNEDTTSKTQSLREQLTVTCSVSSYTPDVYTNKFINPILTDN